MDEAPSDKRALRFYYACAKYAGRVSTRQEEAEEFAAWAYINGQPLFSRPIKFLWIDYLRERSGRKGEASYDVRRNLSAAVPLDETFELATPEASLSAEIDFSRLCHLLLGPDRAILKLKYVWGFKSLEIGECFGVTESRIAQRLKQIEGIISQALAGEKCGQGKEVRRAIQKDQKRKVQSRSLFSGKPKVPMAEVLRSKSAARARLECEANSWVAEIESREMALTYETRYDPWLT